MLTLLSKGKSVAFGSDFFLVSSEVLFVFHRNIGPRSDTIASTSSAGCTATIHFSTPSSGQTPSSSRPEFHRTSKNASSLFSCLNLSPIHMYSTIFDRWIFMQLEWGENVWECFQRARLAPGGCGPRGAAVGGGHPAPPVPWGPASPPGTAEILWKCSP